MNKGYFCIMSTKKFLAFGKILALLLLISYSVIAKPTVIPNGLQDQGTVSFNKAEQSFHKNMLQPQVVHVSMMPEHSVKPINTAYGDLFYCDSTCLLLQPTTQTHLILQDANRCESVSRLLFPFHFFW